MFRQVSKHFLKRSSAKFGANFNNAITRATPMMQKQQISQYHTRVTNFSMLKPKFTLPIPQTTVQYAKMAKYPQFLVLAAAIPFFGNKEGAADEKADESAVNGGAKSSKSSQIATSDEDHADNDDYGRKPVPRRPAGPARELPPVFFLIRRDLDNEARRPVLDLAINNPVTELPFPDWDEKNAVDIIHRIQARLVHAINRVSLCLDPLGQNLAMVNTCCDQLNQERQRQVLPEFSLRTINTFQSRLLDRYERVMSIEPNNLTPEELKETYESLKEAEELCSFDTSLMYTVEQSIQKYHPRHPASFLLASSRAQAEYFRQRRDEITEQLKEDKPDLSQDEFDKELLRRLTQDQTNLGRQIHTRKISEQRRWIEMQHEQAEAQRRASRRRMNRYEDDYDDYDDEYDDYEDEPRRRRRPAQRRQPRRRYEDEDEYDDYEEEPAPPRRKPSKRPQPRNEDETQDV